MAHIDKLPLEIVCHMLGFLKLADQLQLSTVSGRWRMAVEECLGRRRRLAVSDLPRRLTGEALKTVLPRLPALRSLDIRGHDLDLDVVSQHCPHLVSVNLTPFRLDKACLGRLCRRCPRLEALQFPVECSAACVEEVLRLLPGLRSLELEKTPVTADCLSLLPASLERLSLRWCGLPPAAVSCQDCRCPALKVLDVCGVSPPQPAGLAALFAGCPRLERLKADLSGVTDDMLRRLPDLMPRLQHLDVSFCDVTEAGLGCLSRLGELQSLAMMQLDGVTDSLLDQFHGATALTKLALGVEVYYNPVYFTADGLSRLVVACRSLTSLELYVFEEELVQALIDSLARQLSPERDVTLSICETVLELINQPTQPSCPLRLTTFQANEI